MDKITLTIKVVCAVLAAKHIVMPSFFRDYLASIEAGTPRPKPQDYLPQVMEASLRTAAISFLPDPKRKSLFRGKLFLFESPKIMKKLGITVKLGGGDAGLIATATLPVLKDKNTVMIGVAEKLSGLGEKHKAAVGVSNIAKSQLRKNTKFMLKFKS